MVEGERVEGERAEKGGEGGEGDREWSRGRPVLRREMAVGERREAGEEGEEWKAGCRVSVGTKERERGEGGKWWGEEKADMEEAEPRRGLAVVGATGLKEEARGVE